MLPGSLEERVSRTEGTRLLGSFLWCTSEVLQIAIPNIFFAELDRELVCSCVVLIMMLQVKPEACSPNALLHWKIFSICSLYYPVGIFRKTEISTVHFGQSWLWIWFMQVRCWITVEIFTEELSSTRKGKNIVESLEWMNAENSVGALCLIDVLPLE